MAKRQGREWTVESSVLMLDGQPKIDLTTVTKAHYRCESRSLYGLKLSSPDKSVMISGARWKAFSRASITALTELQRSAPHVRVHMRGGVAAASMNFATGVVFLGIAISISVALVVGANDFSGGGIPIALFFALLAAPLVWFFNPWHRDRCYATPKQAASAIKHRGWRTPYSVYDPK